MNISGIRPSEGFYSYNSIRVNKLRNSQIMSSKQAVDDTASQQSIADDTADYEAARARQSFTSLDYANTYDSNASYELKGADSDISTLDVTKAVSDLDKDKVLHQRFVGSADGMVMQQAALNEQINRETENFIL